MDVCQNIYGIQFLTSLISNCCLVLFSHKTILKNCKIFAFAKICTFLVGYEKIRHKRAISFGCIVYSYLFMVRRFLETSWYRTDLCLVIEWFNSKSVVSFSVEVQFNICKYCLILSSCRSHFLWFVHLCCCRIISLNFRHPPYHPPPGMSVLHSVQPAFIPYQDS